MFRSDDSVCRASALANRLAGRTASKPGICLASVESKPSWRNRSDRCGRSATLMESRSSRGEAFTMIDLYYWTTPNGHKITLFLEEAGVPYTIHPVNLGRGGQFKPEFLAISPNNRIPAIVDQDPADGGAPVSIFESGAILLYLAEKTGNSCQRICAAGSRRSNGSSGSRRPWPDGRPKPSFQTIRTREAQLCDRTLCERNQPSLRCSQ